MCFTVELGSRLCQDLLTTLKYRRHADRKCYCRYGRSIVLESRSPTNPVQSALLDAASEDVPAAAMKMHKLHSVGSIFQVDLRNGTPRLYLFPATPNCLKALACLRVSSAWDSAELRVVDFLEEIQSLEYCRLNPNMTVPVLKIDDKVITDSAGIQQYLTDNHPGLGDLDAPPLLMRAIIDQVNSWDEALFAYLHSSWPDLLGCRLRLWRLHRSLKDALCTADCDERLADGRTVLQAYIDKIARVRQAMEVMSGPRTRGLQRQVALNEVQLQAILESASEALATSGGPLLFGAYVSSADALLASLFFFIQDLNAATLDAQFDAHPTLESYWQVLGSSDEAAVIMAYDRRWALKHAFGRGRWWKIPCLQLRLLRPCRLPEAVEQQIELALRRLLHEI